MMRRKYALVACMLALSCVGIPSLLQAANVTVSVTVVASPPCVINGNRTVEVDFGDVFTGNVDGKQHIKDVNYTLECSEQAPNAMQLKVQGNATAFDSSALQTNIADFGVALRANDQPLTINSWLKFSYPSKPRLQAVPVKKAGAKLSGGGFSVGATLLVDYQ